MGSRTFVVTALAAIAAAAGSAWAISESATDLRGFRFRYDAAVAADRAAGKGPSGSVEWDLDVGSRVQYSPSLGLDLVLRQRLPARSDVVPVEFTGSLPGGRFTETRATYKATAKSLGDVGYQAFLADTQRMVNELGAAAEYPTRRSQKLRALEGPVGTVEVTKATGKGRAKVYANFSKYDGSFKWSWRGVLADGPFQGRKVKGSLRLRYAGADRLF